MRKKININKNLYGLIFCATAYLLVKLLINISFFTATVYPSFYRNFYPIYTKVFGWLSFSVGDFMYLFLGLFLVQFIYKFIKSIFKRPVLWSELNKLFWCIGIFYFAFHFLWAFNYYKKPIIELESNEISIEELKATADDIFNQTKKLSGFVPRNQANEFIFDERGFNYFIKDSLKTIEGMNLPYLKFPKVRKKNSIYSLIMNYAGVAGYYNPFTAEAQIVNKIPEISQPFTIAHEQSHQMGYGFESEANFIGYLTCEQSDNVSLKYSANYKALKYLLRAIYPSDSIYVKDKLEHYTSGMRADREAEKRYYEKYESQADKVFSFMNDQYLKSNNQSEGIGSYGVFVDLLINYKRRNN
ncbi:DUF3810 domain-containing protein [Weeksellaceae bacterium TAE3-ERU29]|nr:DUF3810 domain-containing protein [Weeksellaceae bacterium TAE3-ERU29]